MASDDEPNNDRQLLMILLPNMTGRKEAVFTYSEK